MTFDRAAAMALAASAASAFAEGLQEIVNIAEAEVDAMRGRVREEERRIADSKLRLEIARAMLDSDCTETAELQESLSGEGARLAEATDQLRQAEARLAKDRAQFEEERRQWGSDTVNFNVSGEAQISALRSTLSQCADSMLAAVLSGRWSAEKDEDGRIFVDFSPKLFLPLVEYMQIRSIEDPDEPAPPPVLESVEEEANFQRMLSYYGLLEWVYRPEPVDFSLAIGRHRYAVLPPCSPDEAVAGRDMQDLAFLVPRGWEVLSEGADGFGEVLRQLTARCWGAHLLCVENRRGGFDSYRTAVRTVGGPPGSIFQADIDWLERVDGDRRVRFRGLSGRLVIRAKHDSVMATLSRSSEIEACGVPAR